MTEPVQGRSPAEIVQALAERVRQIERASSPVEIGGVVGSSCAAFDRLLPEGGFRRGTLTEWLANGSGSGAASLALIVAREACREGGALVVLDRQQSFYPPAAVALGVELERLIVVRPAGEQDDSWALDQVLRSAGVAAVLSWPGTLSDHAFRRLQLAAESSGALGLLVRRDMVRAQPSWAELRLLVQPLPTSRYSGGVVRRGLRVELLRARGALSGGGVELEIDEETGKLHEKNPMHLAPSLATRTPRRRSAGA